MRPDLSVISSYRPEKKLSAFREQLSALSFRRAARLIAESSFPSDMVFVSPFLRNAHEIFATAREGGEDCRMAIMVQPDGAICMCPGEDWDLECLRRHYGAAMAYGISRKGDRVRVEGRSGAEHCTLETGGAIPSAYLGIENFPQYRLIQ